MISYATFGLLVAMLAVLVRYRDWTTKVGRVELTVVCALGFIALVWATTAAKPYGDYTKGYYWAGRVILEAPQRLYACKISNACFVNLPILAVLLVPFSLLPLPLAQEAFAAVGVALTAYTAWRLSDGAQGLRGRMVLALFVLSGPLAYSVRLGNMTHMLLPVLFLAFDAMGRDRPAPAGALLALAALIKPPLALFLIYFLLRRQFTAFLAMAATAATAATVIVASLTLFGLDLHVFFLRDIVLGFGSRPIVAFNVQSVTGFMGHLFLPADLRAWVPIEEAPWFRDARLGLSGVLVLLTGAALSRAGRPQTPAQWSIELCIILCVALLIAPVTWTHYLCLLLIPMALLISGRLEVSLNRLQTAMFALAAFLLSLPVLFLHASDHLERAVYRLWVSNFFLGAALLLLLLVTARLRLGSGTVRAQASRPRIAELEPLNQPAERNLVRAGMERP